MKPKEVSLWYRVWKRIRHPFTVPAHLVTLTRNVSEKEQMIGNFYLKSVDELDNLESKWRPVVERMEARFKADLEKAQAAIEAAAKRDKANQGNK